MGSSVEAAGPPRAERRGVTRRGVASSLWSLAAFSYDSRALKPFADLTFSFEALRSSGAGGGFAPLGHARHVLGRTAFMSVSAAVVFAIAARSALALRRKSLRMFRPCQSSLSVDSIEATDPAGDGRTQRRRPAGDAPRAARLGSRHVERAGERDGSSMLPGLGGWRALSPRVAPSSVRAVWTARVYSRVTQTPPSWSSSLSPGVFLFICAFLHLPRGAFEPLREG